MSRRPIPSRLLRTAPAAAPASAGHRPVLLALALAAGFSAGPLRAQPSGAQAIHGTAVLSQQGSTLVVNTGNGAGTGHSAINWQSFSIPSGTTTRFVQPSAASTSINRVVGPDPSAIFGTLASNGRLVLVNPNGIAVGAGAVVDTAGFTASTLRMSEADAIAGRLRFGDGSFAGALRVDGQVIARSGDVVLIAPDVQAGPQALVQSPQGATILAAGQKVELTGRGLEGIRFEVQAPADQAVNLGTLSGDAVGVFAGTLRHSGLVQASAVTLDGGRVVLKAAQHAETTGTTTAQGLDGAGGQVDMLGRTVGVMAGALIDTSNSAGGGRIRVGGDYQGGNADVPNAQVAYVAADAQLRANARQQGDGGRVIVWADDTTRAYGRIEAKGGAQGGNGGFVETSGKRFLDVNGARVNASAAQGAAGQWLLDPDSVTIVKGTTALNDSNVTPSSPFQSADGSPSVLSDATLSAAIDANTSVTVQTTAGGDITFDTAANGSIEILKTSATAATVSFVSDGSIYFDGPGETRFTGNPGSGHLTVELRPNTVAGGVVQTQSGSSVQAQTLGSTTRTVTLKLADGATWNNDGQLRLLQNGVLDIGSGGTFNNNGTLTSALTPTTGGLGALGGVSGTGALNSTGSVNLTEGNFNVGGAVSISGDFSFDGAQFSAGSFDASANALWIRSTSGDIVLNGTSDITAAGSLTLQADGGSVVAARTLLGDNVGVSAGNDITVGRVVSSGVASAGANSVSLTAGGSVSYGDIEATAGSSDFARPHGGSVFVSAGAGGAVGGGSILSNGSYGYGGSGGNVTVNAGSGGITVGTIDVSGSGENVGAAGAVTLTTSGAIDAQSIYAYGASAGYGAGGRGGDVRMNAGGSITIHGNVDADGGSSGYGHSLGGASGGLVQLTSGGAIQVFGYVSTAGGSAVSGGPGVNAGQGGTVVASAGAGGITIYGDVDTYGGDAAGSLGAAGGGQVSLGTSGALQVFGTIDASGGDSGTQQAGTAGTVNLQGATGVSTSDIYAWGGDASGARGGDGGRVSITGAGKLQFGQVDVSGGWGGAAAAGGDGGGIRVTQTAGDLALSGFRFLSAMGGEGGGGLVGGQGGAGGTIELNAASGGVLVDGGFLSAGGGTGGYSSGAGALQGGVGGTGGTIKISAAGASQLQAYLDAGGGGGGYADYLSPGRGGTGGAGGSIGLSAPGGMTLGGSLYAGPGIGGRAESYDPFTSTYNYDPARDGAAGTATGSVATQGSFRIAATAPTPSPTLSPTSPPALQAVQLAATSPTSAPSALYVDGAWSNTGALTLDAGAAVTSADIVTNAGSVLLGEGAVFAVGHAYDPVTGAHTSGGGSFTNASTGTLAGSGTVVANVTNDGVVAPGGVGGLGQLVVDGSYTQTATGRLLVDVARNAAPYYPGVTYDQLAVTGGATLGGQLTVSEMPAVNLTASQLAGYSATQLATLPAATDTYDVISAASATGQFSLISGPPDLVGQIRMNIGGVPQAVPGLRAEALVAGIASLLPGVSANVIQQVITESNNNTQFDFDPDRKDEEEKTGASDIVVTDTSCKPS